MIFFTFDQVANSIDAMKYSIEAAADKYRSAYSLPSSTSLAMSMYSNENNSSRNYSDRNYLDPSSSALTKAYFDSARNSSQMYATSHYNHPLDVTKMYSNQQPPSLSQQNHHSIKQSLSPRSSVGGSPDVKINERHDTNSSSTSSSSPSSAVLSPYYSGCNNMLQPSILPMHQFPNQYSNQASSVGEYRRPVSVLI